jgi:hypothetical protein
MPPRMIAHTATASGKPMTTTKNSRDVASAPITSPSKNPGAGQRHSLPGRPACRLRRGSSRGAGQRDRSGRRPDRRRRFRTLLASAAIFRDRAHIGAGRRGGRPKSNSLGARTPVWRRRAFACGEPVRRAASPPWRQAPDWTEARAGRGKCGPAVRVRLRGRRGRWLTCRMAPVDDRSHYARVALRCQHICSATREMIFSAPLRRRFDGWK